MTTPPVDPDDLDWNVSEFGRMAEYATDEEGEPATEPYEDDEPGKHAAPEVE